MIGFLEIRSPETITERLRAFRQGLKDRAGSVEVNPTAAKRPSAGANIVRQRPEKAGEQATADSEVARGEFETAKRDVQLAKTEIENLNAERARLKTAVGRLLPELYTAAERTESNFPVQYIGANVGGRFRLHADPGSLGISTGCRAQ